ncbi:MAG: divalent cation tolerance protein CutA [Alphaproteobacteria bacterium]
MAGGLAAAPAAVFTPKTVAARVTALVETIRSLHSYDCPAVSVLPIENGNPACLDRIAAETAPAAGPDHASGTRR